MSNAVVIEPFIECDKQVSRIGKCEWSVARLIQLSKGLDVFEIPMKHLNICQAYGDVNLRQIVEHMISVNNADLRYPIILDEDGAIMDGRHRIMKALLQGKESIKAVRFDVNPPEDRYHND